MEENNEGTSAEKDGLKKKTKAIKAAEVGEKRKSLMQILNEKKSLKNKNPLYTIEKKRKREETLPDSFSDSDNDDGGVVPQKIHDEMKMKYHKLQRKHQALTQDLDQCKQKSTELENSKSELEQEVVTYREANLTLQNNIDKLLKEVFSQRSVTSRTREPAIPPLTPPGQDTSSEREPDQPIHCPRHMEKKDGKVHLFSIGSCSARSQIGV
nr:cilia- and flagella-associated protein 157-like [Pseudochaenichthys georgianus]